ncbi:ribonuclease 2-like [Aristolochia californica]|uniref:ribonuclease 2-like n=1 Tax=Aristolochia californica TaxID=171875 RepID=UPI0035D9D9B5
MACPTRRPIFSFLVVFILFCFVFDFHQGFGDAEKEFDYFVLSLLWPGTICKQTTHCCESNACCQSSYPLTQFTIHGLWANYNDGSWPACCSGSDFDLNKITSLVGTLERYWPFLTCNLFPVCHGGEGQFWAHEWEKHGTCSYPVVEDEFSYFSMTLDLYFKHNLTEILIDAGYAPTSNGTTYALTNITTTIRNAVGSLPLFVCSDDTLEELHICFYKDLKPRDCDMESSEGSCPAYISLPKFNPISDEGETAIISSSSNT